LAQVLHAKRTVPQRWIAQQLKMGSAAHVSTGATFRANTGSGQTHEVGIGVPLNG
jgi:hypothetical protein